ncbi:GNAT family N-acetyltransferase [Paenibacillus eucommiae]|uniref:GNAT superfamily N-acetyltransferase n=1 Tax=Paenibacillus eucommiae TaxID=1355755 RepID=A0ABS4IN68_9BACL|nr:GNAT family N-acetyltransferase [Paenibacillus eucommiae]MBP1989010.1 GNAT superfamily N-acetyltransferase [Paenibacillus eucommiae]
MITELTTEQEWLDALPVLNELRPDLTEATFLPLMRTMVQEGYRLFALINNEQIQSLAGIAIKTNFYYQRHVFVYDLVTKSQSRSQGCGKALLSYIHQFAKDNDCETVALESGLHRVDAHRFYEKKMNYKKFCYSFKKPIDLETP